MKNFCYQILEDFIFSNIFINLSDFTKNELLFS